MNERRWRWLLLLLAAVILGGCGAKPETKGAEPSSQLFVDYRGHSDPGEIRAFLAAKNIPNGDIYLKDGLLHVNVVRLNKDIEAAFAEVFSPNTYKLINVTYTIQELEAAQQMLFDKQVYKELNIYASGIDVMANRITITLPDTSEAAAKKEIQKLINPGMLSYDIQKLGEAFVLGKIVEIDKV